MKFIDLDYMNQCFDIDFEKGEIKWKERPLSHFNSEKDSKAWHTAFLNRNPGFVSNIKDTPNLSYLKIKTGSTVYLAHRLVYALYHQDSNPPTIDHYDGNGLNNSISNLRPSDPRSNSKNRKKSIKNKSGITGVRWRKQNNKWIANIGDKSIQSYFDDFFEACCFRKSWEIKLGYTKNHGRVLT